ncbi:MAG: hypothetical protein M3483_09165 [Gemmatimonadota bacterium]|nr:hypothetical protein [Gemmatimonadota bacterium]
MTETGEEMVRERPRAMTCGDSREAAVEFLRRELSPEVQEQFREAVRIGALDALDGVVGRVIQEMLRRRGFAEEAPGVERPEHQWRDLVRSAVT